MTTMMTMTMTMMMLMMTNAVLLGLSKFVRLARSVTRNRAATGPPSATTTGASPNHSKSEAPKYSQLANVSSPIYTHLHAQHCSI